MVSGSISLPYSGCFSPFPHGTSSLSVSQEYLALPDGFSRAPHYSGYHYLIDLYLYGTITLYGSSFQRILIHHASNIVVLQPHNCRNNYGLGFSAFARHYLRNHYCFLLLRLLRCFSSPGSPPINRITYLQYAGLPHSDICGSVCMCQSPQLFAAYHVLHRL